MVMNISATHVAAPTGAWIETRGSAPALLVAVAPSRAQIEPSFRPICRALPVAAFTRVDRNGGCPGGS